MRKFFTAFILVTTLFLSTSISFAQVGVIPEGKTIPSTLISEPIEKSSAKTLFELELQALESNIKRVINYSVSIMSLSSEFGTCSGVLIKNTPTESIVLTAKHCIGTVEELYVENILASSVGISLYDDLAYIKVYKMIPNKSSATISEFTPVKGDLVVTIGYPSFSLHVGVGEMQVKSEDLQFAKIHLIPGCSGGGAFNEYGELIGIVWGSTGSEKEHEEETTTIGIFERLEDIVKFVKENKLLE